MKHKHYHLLNKFTANDYRDWLRKPFNATLRGKDYVCSCNGIILLMLPHFENDYDDQTKKFKNLFPDVYFETLITVPVQRIEKALKKAPTIPEYDYYECPACDGQGAVDFEFFHDITYTKRLDCPVCDGECEIQSKAPIGIKIDESYVIEFGEYSFFTNVIKSIVDVAKAIEATEIAILSLSIKGLHVMIDDLEMLVMPCHGVPNKTVDRIKIPLMK